MPHHADEKLPGLSLCLSGQANDVSRGVRQHLPAHFQALFLLFFAANLTHFVHNAEFIAIYPGIPAWLTREKVYLAWLAGAAIGVLGLLITGTRLKKVGFAFVAAYGALGIDGLAHYALALCSEHTLTTNLTIWFEVLAGASLLVASSRLIWHGVPEHTVNKSNA
jgi:hypothetical protein